MEKINVRFHCLDQIVLDILEHFRSGLDPIVSPETFSSEYLHYKPKQIEKAVNQYYNDLSSWKEHFGISDLIDRHKVAAITIHYILNYPPVECKHLSERIAISKIINEIIALNIGFALLINSDKSFDHIEINLRATIYRSLRFHKERLINSPDEYKTCMKEVIGLFAIILYQIEQEHIKIYGKI